MPCAHELTVTHRTALASEQCSAARFCNLTPQYPLLVPSVTQSYGGELCRFYLAGISGSAAKLWPPNPSVVVAQTGTYLSDLRKHLIKRREWASRVPICSAR